MCTVTWPELPTGHLNLGRNGYSKSCGISVRPSLGTIILENINSKGLIGNSRILVPLDNLPQFIAALQKVCDGASRD